MTDLTRCDAVRDAAQVWGEATRSESNRSWLAAARLRLASGLMLASGLTLAGCAVPENSWRPTPEASASMPAPSLSLASITAPVDQQGRYELKQLEKMQRIPAARLREAYILLMQGETCRSISTLNQLMFGNQRYGPAVESYAYFLRAEAYQRQDEIERAAFDRERAAELAIDENLRQKLVALTAATASKVEAKTIAGPRLSLLARSAWSPRRPIESRLVTMGRMFRVTVHHTGMLAQVGPRQETENLLSRIQREHQQQRQWGDIGYHFVIDQDGRIWTCRPLRYQGAHAGDTEKNRGNIGVCLAGNFVDGPSGQSPTQVQVQALERFLRLLIDRYEISPGNIKTHNQFMITVCPGPILERIVAQIRHRMAAVASR